MLLDQETLIAGGKQKGRWPYEAFYNAITSMLDDMPEDDFDELIAWWNEYVEIFDAFLLVTLFPGPFLVMSRFRRMRRQIIETNQQQLV